MSAIYKKELKSYFRSMSAYLFLALYLAASGIYFGILCLAYGYTDFSQYVINNVVILYIVIVPILTMRLFAEEKKQGTDQLLLTAPIRVSSIVLGKYLASLTLLFGTVIINLLEAGILSAFASLSWKTIGTGILGYFLLGAALIAMGMFLSSLTESQMIAAAGSFGAVLLCMLLPNISSVLPERARYAMITVIILAVLVAVLFWYETKKAAAGVAVFVVEAAALAVTWVLKSSLFDNGLSKIISWISVLDRFTDFSSGILNVSSVAFYISFAAVFVILTMWIIEKRRWN